ncbi:hypothetical protein K491DRAFT_54790 [Lophiostoma macrostomum CBS 122681]|uniref:Uncharacterized protein n=1 Tax=Lophiostoma macrostomum CBS 122681 TaxID=1314788 RepID=A0A6A6SX38_9PLEO|nr:hypothetical protein K491DRAFT_54790 [Lophiostoma macrostomum CBS 122681]
MSSSYPYQSYWDPNQVQYAPQFFGHYQENARRSKSPIPMINHPGFSPGPLTTPPLSRNPSQPPEQAPEQMIYDDNVTSLSNSPTVKTPDTELFDAEMLDPEMQDQALDSTSIFPTALLRQHLNATIASQPSHYNGPFLAQTQQMPQMLVPQHFDNSYGYNYPSQPSRQDPWNSERPLQNPNMPTSGMSVFDPASDPADYSPYINYEVNRWRDVNPGPNFLTSPIEPLASPDNNFLLSTPTTQNYQHRPMGLTIPSSAPSHTFVNYDQHTTDFTDGNLFSPSSPNTSMGSSTGQLPSPYYELVGFQASPSSHSDTEDMIASYPDSEPGMHHDQYHGLSDAFDSKPALSVPPVFERAPSILVPEVSSDTSSETDSQDRARSVLKGPGGRPGGRQLGTHLEPEVAKAAHDMRKTVACWHCVLQRDKCGPGDSCERCKKRSLRPNADCGLGCSRIKLIELAPYFIPTLVTSMHEDAHLTHFVTQHIRQWSNVEITLYMTCGQSSMPRIPVKVYEFIPADDELLVQIQYKTDPTTNVRVPVKKQSPALGIVHINHNEEKKYDRYISDIVDHHMLAFADLCWMEDNNDFPRKLLKLMIKLQTKNDDEAKLRREVFRLLVATFIVSHVLNIAEENKIEALSKMRSYKPGAYIQNFTTPRMTNRQLKYFFSRLQRSIMNNVLNKLQQIFKSSKGCDKWIAAFIAVIGMCMAHEDMQKTIHLVQDTKAATEKLDLRDCQLRADFACREIDSRMSFINQIFRWKYNRKCNPLMNPGHDWKKEVGFGDENSVTFVRQVAQLVKENIDFLQLRQNVSISNANQTKYTSRLVSQFLLSFWLPQIS